MTAKTILTVDDSSSIRQMVKFVVSGAGYNISEAESGREGLARAGEKQVDMVITDLNMPVMNGMEFIKELRKIPNYKGMPIIFLTTESAPELKQEGKAAGASGWLTKPFNQDQLLAIIKKFVG
jgi:two-component system, chemotaxis family, chemotaxis protein CheY